MGPGLRRDDEWNVGLGLQLRSTCGSVIRDFDQVLVGVADIDGLDRADGAGARAGTRNDRDVAALQMRR